MLRHARLHLEHYGEEFGLRTFRKHLVNYLKDLKGERVEAEVGQELGRWGELERLLRRGIMN